MVDPSTAPTGTSTDDWKKTDQKEKGYNQGFMGKVGEVVSV